MTRIDEMKQKITELRAQAKVIIDNPESTLEQIKEAQNKLDVAQEKLELEQRLEAQAKVRDNKREGRKFGGEVNEEEVKAKYKQAFFNAVKNELTLEDKKVIAAYNKLSSHSGKDGGYLIPIDQQTKINELKKTVFCIRNYARVETTNTKSGSRILEKRAASVPFALMTEGGKIKRDMKTPEFDIVNYDVKPYGGILPVSNELLDDEQAALEDYLNRWFALKSVATDNYLFDEKIKELPTVKVKNFDDMKDIINVKLDMAFKPTSKVFMSQTAFNHFSKLKDENGNYLMEKDPKNTAKRVIEGLEVVEMPDNTFSKPIFIGDMKEFLTIFDRKRYSLDSTDVGGDAFATNTTEFRGMLREDQQIFDKEAMIFAEIEVPAES